MLKLKQSKSTINNFNYALKACKSSSVPGPYAEINLNLVGVYYETDFLKPTVLANPTLDVDISGKGKNVEVEMTVELKPEPSDLESLKRLDEFLHFTGMGKFFDKPTIKPEQTGNVSMMDSYLNQGSAVSPIQNYDLTLTMKNPEVTKSATYIGTTKYYQYTLKDTFKVEDVEYSHCVHVLFKHKTSDGENFFSGLVGRDDLDKRDTRKILDTLSDINLTGLFIGGTGLQQSESRNRGAIQRDYATFSPFVLKDKEDHYGIYSANTSLSIDKEKIKKIKVFRAGNTRYTLKVSMTTKEEIIIWIG